jgi:hypothetical protein
LKEAAWASVAKPKAAVMPAIATALFKSDLKRVIVVLKPITKGVKLIKKLKDRALGVIVNEKKLNVKQLNL